MVTDKQTAFICLKRAAFQRLLRTSANHQVDGSHYEFLQSLCFFDDWSHGELSRLTSKVRHVIIPVDVRLFSDFFLIDGIL